MDEARLVLLCTALKRNIARPTKGFPLTYSLEESPKQASLVASLHLSEGDSSTDFEQENTPALKVGLGKSALRCRCVCVGGRRI